MADLDQQIRTYARGLDLGPAISPAEVIAAAGGGSAPGRRAGRRAFLAAAAVLVVVVLGAAVLALRDDADDPAPTVDTTVVPSSWERIGEVDDAQPFAMAASDRGVVLAGYGFWWSADGTSWEEATVDGQSGFDVLRPDQASAVIATVDGFLAVGTGDDEQPAVWRSDDGRSWARVQDDDLRLPTGSIPSDVSTPYGSIDDVVATEDGFIAVGQEFTGRFVGTTQTEAIPFRPAIWTSPDGSSWNKVEDLPEERGSLVGVTDTDDGIMAIGTAARHSFVWRSDGDRWRHRGGFEGTVTSLGKVGGRLVATGSLSSPLSVDDREPGSAVAAATLWSSPDGEDWDVADQQPRAALSTYTSLVEDGDLLLALGYAGAGEQDVHGLLMTSADGTTWTPGPVPAPPAPICGGPAGSGQTGCPTTSSYPQAGALLGSTLLLATTESETTAPPGYLPASSLQTGVHRAADRSAVPADPPGLSASIDVPQSIAAGAQLETFVTVRNDTGAPIEGVACGRPYAVELHGETYSQHTAWLTCWGTFTLPVGTSQWPVTIWTRRSSCLGPGGQGGDDPPCDPDGSPPALAPGTYAAIVVSADSQLPIPDSATIRIE